MRYYLEIMKITVISYMEVSQEYYISLIERLKNMPDETEWLNIRSIMTIQSLYGNIFLH